MKKHELYPISPDELQQLFERVAAVELTLLAMDCALAISNGVHVEIGGQMIPGRKVRHYQVRKKVAPRRRPK